MKQNVRREASPFKLHQRMLISSEKSLRNKRQQSLPQIMRVKQPIRLKNEITLSRKTSLTQHSLYQSKQTIQEQQQANLLPSHIINPSQTMPNLFGNQQNSLIQQTSKPDIAFESQKPQQEAKIEEEQSVSLNINFSESNKHLRSTLRESLKEKEYNKIDLSFEEEMLDMRDCLLFKDQQISLRELTFRFAKTGDFSEETLTFLQYLPLKSLRSLNLLFVIVRNPAIKTLVSYSIFYLQKIQNILIYFVSEDEIHQNLSELVPNLVYSKEKAEIPIELNRFQNLTRIDIENLEIQLEKYKPKSISVTLSGKPQLEKQSSHDAWLNSLGHSLSSINSLSISFANCSLNPSHMKSFLDGIFESNSKNKPHAAKTSNNEQEQSNTLMETLKLNFSGCDGISHLIFADNIGKLISLKSLEITFDKAKQIINQYESYFAFKFIKHFAHIDQVILKQTNSPIAVYSHSKTSQQSSISVKSLHISPFQLIDIKRSLNQNSSTCKILSCDLSDNFKLSFKNILRFFDEIEAIKNQSIKSLTVNIRNLNISEIESLCIYLNLLASLPSECINFASDVDISKLLAVSLLPQKELLLLHIGESTSLSNPSFEWKVHFLFRSLMRLQILFEKVHIKFFYNYQMTVDILTFHVIPFLLNNRDLSTLIFDFNHCCFDHSEVLLIIQIVFETTKQLMKQKVQNNLSPENYFAIDLTFLNNISPDILDVQRFFQDYISGEETRIYLKQLSITTDEFKFEKFPAPIALKSLQLLPVLTTATSIFPFTKKVFQINKKQQLIPKKLFQAKNNNNNNNKNLTPKNENIIDFSIFSLKDIDESDYFGENVATQQQQQQQQEQEQQYFREKITPPDFYSEIPKRDRQLISTSAPSKEALILFEPDSTKQKIEAALKEIAQKHAFKCIHIPESQPNYEAYEKYYLTLLVKK